MYIASTIVVRSVVIVTFGAMVTCVAMVTLGVMATCVVSYLCCHGYTFNAMVPLTSILLGIGSCHPSAAH